MAAVILAAAGLLGLAGCATFHGGWTPLFDGRTLRGWKEIQGSAKFEVRDGAAWQRLSEWQSRQSTVPTNRPGGVFYSGANRKVLGNRSREYRQSSLRRICIFLLRAG